MNLIYDPWIPIRRRDGRQHQIAPWQLTEQYDTNPIVDILSPRGDFGGALMEFLIGLLQTTSTIEREEDWEDAFEDPPSSDELRTQLDPVAPAFEFDGPGPRFMQDFDLSEGETKEIASLLIDAPGDNSLRNNLDHFIKRDYVQGMCAACAATALFTLQTNAPAGGAGHRTSLRGGGPLTTLVICDPRQTDDAVSPTLWRNLWLNVLETPEFLNPSGNPSKTELADVFPWLAPTRASDKTGRNTTADDVSPSQMFWGMPRRIRLDFEALQAGRCDICGTRSESLVTQYITKNYGINYVGPWLHPLTPHSFDKQKMPLPRHPQPGGMSYRHWLGLVHTIDADEQKPARVVDAFNKRRLGMQLRLWAFGYDMDNMKARCWYESQIPLYQLEETIRHEFAATVAQLVQAADTARTYLFVAVKDAWFDKGALQRKTDISFIGQAFWQDTEREFYGCLGELAEKLAPLENRDERLILRTRVKQAWHGTLCRQAQRLFDQWANSEAIAYANPRRIATAHNQLHKNLYGSKLCTTILELPKKAKAKGVAGDATAVSAG